MVTGLAGSDAGEVMKSAQKLSRRVGMQIRLGANVPVEGWLPVRGSVFQARVNPLGEGRTRRFAEGDRAEGLFRMQRIGYCDEHVGAAMYTVSRQLPGCCRREICGKMSRSGGEGEVLPILSLDTPPAHLSVHA